MRKLALVVAALLCMASGTSWAVDICDRTPGVRDAILALVAATACQNVPADQLAGIEELNLSNAGLAALKTGDFDSLTRLEQIYLDRNQLASLPSDIFDSLTTLAGLNLDNNQLTSLPAGVFDSLTYLNWLSLESNQLTSLPAGIFDSLSRVTLLILSNNHLVGLSADDPLFSQLPAGVEIRLRGQTRPPWDICNRTQQVQDAILAAITATDCRNAPVDQLAGIFELQLANAGLGALKAGDFALLTHLEVLYLNQNRLTSLPAGVFDGLGTLAGLTLADNRLTSLPAGVFDSLTSLNYLILSNNHLVGLSADDPLFSRLPADVDLRLDGQTPVSGGPPPEPPEPPEPPTPPTPPEEPEIPGGIDEPDYPDDLPGQVDELLRIVELLRTANNDLIASASALSTRAERSGGKGRGACDRRTTAAGNRRAKGGVERHKRRRRGHSVPFHALRPGAATEGMSPATRCLRRRVGSRRRVPGQAHPRVGGRLRCRPPMRRRVRRRDSWPAKAAKVPWSHWRFA